jgi:hypothetical protein
MSGACLRFEEKEEKEEGLKFSIVRPVLYQILILKNLLIFIFPYLFLGPSRKIADRSDATVH